MIKKSDKNKEAWTTLNEFISLWFRLCSNGDSAFNWFWEKEEFKKWHFKKQKPDRIRVL
jgi:hypothetical protein